MTEIVCGCGAKSLDGYWPTKKFNTVDIDVEARVGNVDERAGDNR